jgi:hypothetical protein
MGQYRFYGVIDLLTTDKSGNIVIYDWKTNQKKPGRTTLNQKIQTRLYRLMAAFNYARFFDDGVFSPEKIKMSYWFANDPAVAVDFPYDETLFITDQSFFQHIIESIQNTPLGEFAKTEEESKCKFCNYRSLCARGVQAGVIQSIDDLPEDEDLLNFDLTDLPELEF